MRFRTILCLATLYLTCFTVAGFAQLRQPEEMGFLMNRAPENQSVSGRISSVGDAVFAIDVVKGNQGQQTVQFLVDDKTKVEGKLTVGAQAVVEYRSDGAKNIAVHVVVTPASGVNPYFY